MVHKKIAMPKELDMKFNKINNHLPPEMQGINIENMMKWGLDPKHAPVLSNRFNQHKKITDMKTRLRMKLINRYTTSENSK